MAENITKKEFETFLNKFNKEPGEYTEDELYIIGTKYKLLPTSEKRWNELVLLLEPKDKDGNIRSGEAFRLWLKNQQMAKGELPKNVRLLSGQTINDLDFNDFKEKTEELKQDLYIQQVQTRDTWTAYRKTLRNTARIDNFKDMIQEAIKTLEPLPEVKYTGESNNEAEAVLMLSDWHIGVEIENAFNTYNLEIARKRISKLCDNVIKYCKQFKISKLNVLNLNDLIAGHIHVSGRLEQEIDVIEQVVRASELISELLIKLQAAAPEISYYSCTDNHSRTTPNLKEHLEAESFVRLVDLYVETRIKDSNVKIVREQLDPSMGIIRLKNGKIGVYEHGHLGSINNFFQDMVCYIGEKIDYGFIGHYHNEKVKTLHTFKLFVNGSLVGMDPYALSKRLFSKPAQSLIIFDQDNIINCSIGLDIN